MFRLAMRSFRRPLWPCGLRQFSESYTQGAPEMHQFKAETKKLLEIVAKSLYMDKEVFARELVSNASDALEKLNSQVVSGATEPRDLFKVQVYTDENENTFTIKDNGVGMTSEEMVKNLGTIAYSGSSHFLNSQEQGNDTIIGQFGVGFYSAFIVANQVKVISKTANCPNAHLWSSQGLGEFTLSELEGDFEEGTQVILQLKEDCKEFATDKRVHQVVKKYSHFIAYPIEVNGTHINAQEAIWARNKTELTEDNYRDFYEYITGSKLTYKYVFHFNLDMPLQIRALLYIPSTHSEKFGLSHEEPSVDLYSKKVLIKSKCKELFPQWLRFLRGVVDCADIPLNVSRETHQDSVLMNRINAILTAKIIKALQDEAKRSEEAYMNWYDDFGNFIVEGLAIDASNTRELAPLARFSWSLDATMVPLSTYIEHMKEDQTKIYYLFTPSRDFGLNSPYLEPFNLKGIPVIFSLHHIDEMIFRSMQDFQGHKFVNIESSMEELEDAQVQKAEYDREKGVPEEDLVAFTEWVKNELTPYVSKVVPSKRLRDSPAIIVGEMPSAMRQMYKLMDKEKHSESYIRNQTLEINMNHEIMVNLNMLRKGDAALASDIIAQVLDNTLIMAGIFENAGPMTKRINKLLLLASRTNKEQLT